MRNFLLIGWFSAVLSLAVIAASPPCSTSLAAGPKHTSFQFDGPQMACSQVERISYDVTNVHIQSVPADTVVAQKSTGCLASVDHVPYWPRSFVALFPLFQEEFPDYLALIRPLVSDLPYLARDRCGDVGFDFEWYPSIYVHLSSRYTTCDPEQFWGGDGNIG